MTVAEYIEKLKELPSDLPVCQQPDTHEGDAPDEDIFGPQLQQGSYIDSNGAYVHGEYVLL